MDIAMDVSWREVLDIHPSGVVTLGEVSFHHPSLANPLIIFRSMLQHFNFNEKFIAWATRGQLSRHNHIPVNR